MSEKLTLQDIVDLLSESKVFVEKKPDFSLEACST